MKELKHVTTLFTLSECFYCKLYLKYTNVHVIFITWHSYPCPCGLLMAAIMDTAQKNEVFY